MANKIAIPSIVGLNTEGVPLNVITFLQAVEEALKTLDNGVVYKDQITLEPPTPSIRAKTAQGNAFSISGVVVASGDDHGALVNDMQAVITSLNQQAAALKTLTDQVRGT